METHITVIKKRWWPRDYKPKPRGVLGFEKGTDCCPTVTVIANVAGKKGRAVQSLYTHIRSCQIRIRILYHIQLICI